MKQSYKGGKDLILIRYIPQGNEILADSTIIIITPLKVTCYPLKHFENQTIKGRSPPTLVQQCIISIERLITVN